MSECLNSAARAPKRFAIAGFEIEIENLGLLALEEAVTGAGIDAGKNLHPAAAALEDYRQGNAVVSRGIRPPGSEFQMHSQPAGGKLARLFWKVNK
jgi:hypothetical protein